MRPLAAGILAHGHVAPREREIVILRVCARCDCEYEWGVHVTVFGRLVGLSDEHIQATARTLPADPIWSERDSLLIRLVDELHESANVSDALWTRLARYWEEAQLLELLVTAGWYHVISFVTNGVRIQREEWTARFPVMGD